MKKTAVALVGFAAAGFGARHAHAEPVYDYSFTLAAVNNSGVSGSGTMVLDGTDLTVSVTASGFVPNALHPFHIHGLLGAAAPSTQPAPPSADANADGFVEKPEGAPYEGPPIFDLPQTGTLHGYSTAPGGVISFTQTYNLANASLYDPDMMGLSLTTTDIEGLTGGSTVPLTDRLVEFHGLGGVSAAAAALNGTVLPPGTTGYDPEKPVAVGRIRLTSVPEPATLALLGSAVGLAGLRRRGRV